MQQTGTHERAECPQLKKPHKKNFNKKKAMVATWSDSDESSSDDEESKDEVANLCLMAKEDDLQEEDEVRNSSFASTFSVEELQDAWKTNLKRALLAASICFPIGEMDSLECSSPFIEVKDRIFYFPGIGSWSPLSRIESWNAIPLPIFKGGFLWFFFYESKYLLKAANSYELVHRVAGREGGAGREGLSMAVTRRLPKVIVESDFLMPLNEGSVGWDFGFPHYYRGRTLPWIEKGELEGGMLQLKGVRAWQVSSGMVWALVGQVWPIWQVWVLSFFRLITCDSTSKLAS